ncbi:MAG: SUMF1/EgtB/PvdO family nonheme iron enzyme, partial [Akkermansiaceae bacterium]
VTSTPLCGLAIALITSAALLPQAHAVTIAHGGDSVDIDFVDIGNVDNAADTTGYGAVDYEYSIGTYEVTAAQWASVSSFDANVGSAGTWSGAQPTASASWYEAAKFANWLTSGDALSGAYQFSDATTFTGVDRATALTTYGTIYVLPSEDEWYKAAYFKSDGSGYTTYATGNTHPASGTDANYNNFNFSPWNVGSGSIENNGTYDMGGNVWEWNESAFAGGEPAGGESRVLRGGDWESDSFELQSSKRSSDIPVSESWEIGFRVASVSLSVVPEPSSVGLLVIGALGCVMRRKRS